MVQDKGFLYKTLEAVEDHLVGVIIGALVLGGVGTWVAKMYSTHVQGKTEQARIQAGYKLHVGDVNNNGLIDKFYLINGNLAILELDDKPVVENPTINNKLYE